MDIGGTKTRVRAEDAGRPVLDVTVPSAQWQRGGLLDDPGNAARLVALFHNLDGARIAPLVIGAHGLDSDWQTLRFQTAVSAVHDGAVRAVNDAELLGPAAGFAESIALIAGTGSKVIAHSASGELLTAGGYGFLLSDPGSAAALARESVRAILDARDAGAQPDSLALSLMGHFGVEDEVALSYAFTANARLTVWAAMAPLVFEAADAGSMLAQTVVDTAAAELAAEVKQVVARGAVGADVVCAGGVISNQSRLFGALARHIDALGLGLTVHLLEVSPVLGALELARAMPVSEPATATSSPS